MTEPRQIQIHKSINRPHLLLGADRGMVLMTGTLTVMLAASLRSWWGAVLALFVWFAVLWMLVRLAKADPLMRPVYLRHIKYRKYYEARSGLAARPVRLPRHWDRRIQ